MKRLSDRPPCWPAACWPPPSSPPPPTTRRRPVLTRPASGPRCSTAPRSAAGRRSSSTRTRKSKWEVVDGAMVGSGFPVDALQRQGQVQELQVPHRGEDQRPRQLGHVLPAPRRASRSPTATSARSTPPTVTRSARVRSTPWSTCSTPRTRRRPTNGSLRRSRSRDVKFRGKDVTRIPRERSTASGCSSSTTSTRRSSRATSRSSSTTRAARSRSARSRCRSSPDGGLLLSLFTVHFHSGRVKSERVKPEKRGRQTDGKRGGGRRCDDTGFGRPC